MNPTSPARRRMLAVDDEPHVLSALRRALRQHFGDRLELETFEDPLAALARSRECEFDIVISDLRMPETDGIVFLTLMAAVQPRSVRMMLTGSADFESAQRAVNDAQVFRYLQALVRARTGGARAGGAAAGGTARGRRTAAASW